MPSRPAPSFRSPTIVIVLTIITFGGAGAVNPASGAQSSITVTEALPTLLQRGTRAFAAGDYASAAATFRQIERDFGSEPEWQTGPLPRRLLPLRGFAELQAGLPADAIESLGAFIDRFPDDASQRSFVLYALALACRQNGELEEALTRFATFENENPLTAQAALARFQRAEILFELDRSDEAIALLQELAKDAVSESLAAQARLRALQTAVELERDEVAEELLLGSPWAVNTMPEIAVLAFAAMELGDRLMADGQPDDAIRAYRLVLPRARLLSTQQTRLEELQALFAERAPTVAGGSGSFWVDFYRARIARIEAQLEALRQSDDYTAPLRLRRGQAFLLAERHREAWLVFEHLALDEKLDLALRRSAHYRWILAAAGLERWNEALVIAREFVARHPGAAEAPEAFYLIARAHLESHRFPEAEAVLTDILERFPDHASAGRARFTRGWVRTMQERYSDARTDFDDYRAAYPDGPLRINAELWRALSFFFERRYDEALVAFDELAKTATAHPLYAEVLYRRGTTLYAMRDFPRARTEMEAFVENFRAHPRYAEALVLLGDILMGAGELKEARERFASVPMEVPASFVYAVFQTGKILKAENDYDAMVAHYARYAGRDDLPAQPRISEALYWIGWAEEQRGQPAAAMPVYFDALDRFGDNPTAGEVGPTLSALERLARRMRRSVDSTAASARVEDPRMQPLLETDFGDWLETERQRALEESHFTYHARLTIALADRHARAREPYQEEARLLDLAGAVPIEALDATGLARVGLALQRIGSEAAKDHFERLLDVFPQSLERGAAFYGLAASAAQARSFPEARRWLAHFDAETPTHPLAPRAALLAGSVLEESGALSAAIEEYEALLRLKSGRGRTHAEALLGIARCYETLNDSTKAIAYCQRIYTLYRAYDDLVAEAYLHSAPLFEERDDLQAAAGTYREMLATAEIGDAAQRETARRALAALETRLATQSRVESESEPEVTP